MTGFERWVLAGLELGALEVLNALGEATDAGDLEGEPTREDQAKAAADVLISRWPPWRLEAQRQQALALDLYPCDNCARPVAFSSTKTTARGRLCVRCMDMLIKGEL